jgi:hypothetical protein
MLSELSPLPAPWFSAMERPKSFPSKFLQKKTLRISKLTNRTALKSSLVISSFSKWATLSLPISVSSKP